MKKLILIACFARLLTQMFANDTLYAIGIFTFELLALIYFFLDSKGVIRSLMMFFIGIACYDLFKYLYLYPHPHEIDLWEYLNTITGIVFIIGHHVYKVIARHRTRHS